MKKLYWTVKIGIDEIWIADGFNLTEDRLIEMIRNDLSYAYSHEINAKILTSPRQDTIQKIQGYKV